MGTFFMLRAENRRALNVLIMLLVSHGRGTENDTKISHSNNGLSGPTRNEHFLLPCL